MPATSVDLPRAVPEEMGISSRKIAALIDAVDRDKVGLHSFMLLRRGAVVAEGWWKPYQRDNVHFLYSLSKSFTSTAIGLCVDEGRLSINDTVISIFPDETPTEPSDNLRAMRVRHLLSMSTGHAEDDFVALINREDGDWIKGFLARDVPFEPGTHFLYNNASSYMLSAIVQKVTGMTTLDYLRPRLLDPMGVAKATWDACPKGRSIGATGLSVTTETIAKFGHLYLRKGMWNDERLLSEAWVEDATGFHVSNASNDQPDWQQGYGFQFWRSRHNCYRGDGAFGQFCVVMPETGMVMAITAGVDSMQAVLDLVWEHILLPVKAVTLPADESGVLALTQKLEKLNLPGPDGKVDSPASNSISGRQYKRTADEGLIETVQYEFDDAGCTLTTTGKFGQRVIRAGAQDWMRGSTTMTGSEQQIAAQGAWTSEDTYEIKVYYTEYPMSLSIISTFKGDHVSSTTTLRHTFSPTEGPSFEGTASA